MLEASRIKAYKYRGVSRHAQSQNKWSPMGEGVEVGVGDTVICDLSQMCACTVAPNEN